MSDKDVKVFIRGDTTEFDRTVEQVGRKLDELGNRAGGGAARGIEVLGRQAKTAEEPLKDTGAALDKVVDAAGKVGGTGGAGASPVDAAAKKIDGLSKEATEAKKPLTDAAGAIDKVGEAAAKVGGTGAGGVDGASRKIVDLGRNADQAERPLSRAAAAITSIGVAAGIAAGTALLAYTAVQVRAIQQTIDQGDALAKLHDRLGLSVQALSAYTYAAERANVPQEQLAVGLRTFNVRIDEALAGVGQSAALFQRLGIDLSGLRDGTKTINDVFLEFVDRMAGMREGAGKTRIAYLALGESGERLLPMMRDGSRGLREMHDEAKELGRAMDEEAARSAEKFRDEIAKLTDALGASGRQIAQTFFPTLAKVVSGINDVIKARGLLELINPFDLAGVSISDSLNPGPKILELQASLDRMRTRRKAIEESAANNSFLRNLPLVGTASDPAAIDLQIQNAEKRLTRLQEIQTVRAARVVGGSVHRTQTDAPDVPDKPKRTGRAYDPMADEGRSLQAQMAIEDEARALGAKYQLKWAADQQRELDAMRKLDERSTQAYYEGITRAAEAYDQSVMNMNRRQKDSYEDLKRSIEGWGREFSRTMGEALITGNLTAGSLSKAFRSMAIDIASSMIQRNVANPLMQLAEGALGSLFGGGAPANPNPTRIYSDAAIPSWYANIEWQADGGIVGPHGAIPLRRYAMGGVATRPQLAVFGEGDQNEAFVPLPDGRRIPVAMQGGQAISIVIRNEGAPKEVSRATPVVTPEGIVIEVVTRDLMSGGPVSQAMERTFSLGRAGG